MEPKRIHYLLYSNANRIYTTDDDVYLNDKSLLEPGDHNDNGSLVAIAQKKMRMYYAEMLKNSAYKNTIILTGAGSSVEGTKKQSGNSAGEDRIGLWKAAESKLGNEVFEMLKTQIGYEGKQNDIEEFLTQVYLFSRFNPNAKIVYGENKEITVKEIIDEIKTSIVDECSLVLDGDIHKQFLSKVANRNLKLPRTKMFTTNYDTLIEQAAQDSGIIIIDGFSFTMPRTFSGRNFDYDIVYRDKSRIKNEESFVPKVLHLYKMHGSLDWEKKEERVIINNSVDKENLIIYPTSNKYESSFEQPFFEMMSRFQNYLRQENTLLIIIGFSLYDKHISNVILEAVNQNPSFTLIVCNYYKTEEGENSSIPIENEFLAKFVDKENVYFINEKFSDFAIYYPANRIYTELNNPSNEN